MSEPKVGNAELAELRDDLAALKRDVTALIEHLKADAANAAQSAVGKLDDNVRQVYRNVAAEGERSVKAISQKIEEQPLLILLAAFGFGYIGGRMLSR